MIAAPIVNVCATAAEVVLTAMSMAEMLKAVVFVLT